MMHIRYLIFGGVVGFLIYELIRILSGGDRNPRRRAEALRRALNSDTGRMNVTGPGRGTVVEAEDADGARSHHVVGRGVVR